MSSTRIRRAALAASALAAVAVAATVSPAAAGGRPRLDVSGGGTYTTDASGAAVITGTVTGDPFGGPVTATLAPADGTLPEPATCETATVTLRVDGSRDRFVELTSTDEVCGQHVQPPYVVTQVFTGRYTVTATSQRRLAGTDGFVEVRLTNDGRAHVSAIDT